MSDHAQCQELAKKEVTKVPNRYSPGYNHWKAVRESMPRYFWNRIKAPRIVTLTDAQLVEKIEAAKGDIGVLVKLIRQGGRIEDHVARCEWCNEPL